ncbi:MAG: RNA-guided pseudouridylation complex pseudouridine synthase subunit Cbf5 [Candidatus Nanohaloarchaeota archaeon]|nr:RNA-guided pseudouridylation complex pseudouridine synthase subunit Cbf5 [Candidatus Nanohaloarchaeota archaeon]
MQGKSYYVKDPDYQPDPELGKYPHERSVEERLKSGIVVVDKPASPSSQQVSSWVKEMLKVNKAGHVGTLDPSVSGVLPILLGKATKIMPYMHLLPKTYVTLMHLHEKVDPALVEKVLNDYVGKDFLHTPPKKSAVKRKPRKRKIYDIEVLEIEGKDVLFKATVESGTYMRVFCIDVGKKLGVKAHMQELRRIESGGFSEEHAVDLNELKEKAWLYFEKQNDDALNDIIYPVERGVKHLPKVFVKDVAVSAILYGAPLYYKGIVMAQQNIKEGEIIAVMTMKGELVGIFRSLGNLEDIKKKFKGIFARPLAIVMDRNAYPKLWKAKENEDGDAGI